MLHRALAFVALLSLAACLDKKDYTLDSVRVTPTVAMPLTYGEVSILDLVSNKDAKDVKMYSDSLLYFYYSDTLISQDINHLFKIHNDSLITSFDLPPGTLPPSTTDIQLSSQTKAIDLNLAPEQLSEILLKTGSFVYTVSLSQATSPTLPLEVVVTLTDVVDKVSQLPLVVTAVPGSGSSPLQNYIMKLDKNKFNVKLDLILKKRTTPVLINANTEVDIKLEFTGMDFSYIKGFLGDQVADIPTETMDVGVFSSSLNKTKISFVQPIISLLLVDDYSLPCELTFSKLEATKPGGTLPLQINPASPVNLNSPIALGSSATTNISVQNATNIINFSPTQMSYTASARINKGLTSGVQVLADTSKLRIILEAEVPMYGQASGLTMTDTMKLDFGKVERVTILTAAMKINSINELPLDAHIQLYLADQDYHIVDSVFANNQTYIVKASSVTGSGELQTVGATNVTLNLEGSWFTKLFTSSFMIVRANMNTTKDANNTFLNVKFKSSYKLKLNVGLLAQVDISSK